MSDEANFSRMEFPYSLSFQKTKVAFEYLARELPGWVEYSLETEGYIGWERFGERWINNEKTFLKGGIVHRKNSMDIISFKMIPRKTSDNLTYYHGISFDTIPGYSKEELRRTATSNPDLMDDIRKKVLAFFVEQKTK